MSIKTIISGMLLVSIGHQVLAGDAVAIGFNWEGVWTAVTYVRSSSPKRGSHYHDAAQASIFAVQDLHRRASTDLVRTKVIGQSDQTGYVTVARGTSSKPNTGVTVIGRGKSQSEADSNALQKLTEAVATENESIVYRYFSYGAESASPSHAPSEKRAPVRKAMSQRGPT